VCVCVCVSLPRLYACKMLNTHSHTKTHKHVRACSRTRARTHARTHTHTHTHTYTYKCAYMNTFMYICICIFTHVSSSQKSGMERDRERERERIGYAHTHRYVGGSRKRAQLRGEHLPMLITRTPLLSPLLASTICTYALDPPHVFVEPFGALIHVSIWDAAIGVCVYGTIAVGFCEDSVRRRVAYFWCFFTFACFFGVRLFVCGLNVLQRMRLA